MSDDIMRVLPERGKIEQNFEKGDETHLFSSHFLLLVSRPISRVIRRSKEGKSIEFHTKKNSETKKVRSCGIYTNMSIQRRPRIRNEKAIKDFRGSAHCFIFFALPFSFSFQATLHFCIFLLDITWTIFFFFAAVWRQFLFLDIVFLLALLVVSTWGSSRPFFRPVPFRSLGAI